MPALHVALLHNPSAGSERHSGEELIGAIEAAGHRVVARVSHGDDLRAGLPANVRCDLVAVAGGDGTVGRAAIALIGSNLPVAVLPLGTANNISRTLGIRGTPQQIISGWGHHAECVLDVGVLMAGGTTSYFAEAIGLGVFPAVMKTAGARAEPATPRASLARDRSLFRRAVQSAVPRFYHVAIDGRDCSGHYLLVQVMNIAFLGPNLKLGSASHPGDGQLDVVLVGDADRHALDELIAATALDQEPPLCLPTLAAKRVTVTTEDSEFHLDGDLRQLAPGREGGTRLDVDIQPSALRMWVSPHEPAT
jgi:diacylglycerol kinase (ATP)